MMPAGSSSKTLRMASEIRSSGTVGRAEALHHDGDGVGHADGVGELDLAAFGKAGRDDVLGHIACHVGGGAVHLGGILAGEGAAAVPAHAAVGVHDDLAAGEARCRPWGRR